MADSVKVVAPADLYVPAVGDYVTAGDVVEVDRDTGESLKAQGWKGAGNKRPDVSALRDLEPATPDDPAEPVVASLPDVDPDAVPED